MSDMLRTGINELLASGKFVVLIYFVGVNLWYLALLVSSMLELRRHILLISECK